MRVLFFLPLFLAGSIATGEAQTSTATLNVAFSGLARLTLSTGSLAFQDADPDTVPQVTASPAVIAITAKARATQLGLVTLTVQASGDLRSGVSTIPASMLTWTATGSGFVPGTLSAAAPQTVASWTGPGVHAGSQAYLFRNLWTHPAGIYTLTLLYTLSAA